MYSVHNVCRDEGVYPVIRGFFLLLVSARESVEIGHAAVVPHIGMLREMLPPPSDKILYFSFGYSAGKMIQIEFGTSVPHIGMFREDVSLCSSGLNSFFFS